MVVNERLVREAQLLTTGAEVHKTHSLIAMYRGAAKDETPQSQNAFKVFEKGLEDHVAKLRAKRLLVPRHRTPT